MALLDLNGNLWKEPLPEPPLPENISDAQTLITELGRERNDARRNALNQILDSKRWDFSGIVFEGIDLTHIFFHRRTFPKHASTTAYWITPNSADAIWMVFALTLNGTKTKEQSPSSTRV